MTVQRIISLVAILLISTGAVGCEPTEEAPGGQPDAGEPDTGPEDAGTDADADADAGPPAPPEMQLSLEHITFEGVRTDEVGRETITVDNQGEADLTIERMELSMDDSSTGT